jgi:hypothetical protein
VLTTWTSTFIIASFRSGGEDDLSGAIEKSPGTKPGLAHSLRNQLQMVRSHAGGHSKGFDISAKYSGPDLVW